MQNWTGEIINVISVGASPHLQLCDEAAAVLERAEVIFGAEHHFTTLSTTLNLSAEHIIYPRPWSDMTIELEENRSKTIVLLASGDALFFGLGSWLIAQVGEQHCRFFCNISSAQAAFSLLKKPWESAQVISLHGRSKTNLKSRIRANHLYAILTDNQNTPQVVATELSAMGFSKAKIWVVEAMNDQAQNIRLFNPEQLAAHSEDFHCLNVCVLESGSGKLVIPEFPGFPDTLFSRPIGVAQDDNLASSREGGMFTKREVRLAILSYIQPCGEQIGWDVGAGFGSVTIEWARWQSLVTIHAVENNPQRMEVLKQNINKFGVSDQVATYEGLAPVILQKLPTPDVVYIGGSQGGIELLLDYCWRRLSEHGRIVVSAVTEFTKASLIAHVETKYAKQIKCIEWTEITVSKGRRLGGQLIMQPKLPVLLLCIHKQAWPYGK